MGSYLLLSGLYEGCGLRDVRVTRLGGKRFLLFFFFNLEESMTMIKGLDFEFNQLFFIW